MAYYLQMDGVDDRIVLPSMTFTEVIIDFRVNSKAAFEKYWSGPTSVEYFQVASGGVNDTWSAGVSSLYLNGVSQTINTPIMAVGVRGIARTVMGTSKTFVISIFANGTGNIAHGDIWNIKIYNGATLQAHYDMTLGNVQDQSGNGRHATLVGGTWVDEGGGSSITGGATLIGTGSLTASGATSIKGGSLQTGTSSLSATGKLSIAGGALLSGVGLLSCSGSLMASSNISGGASLVGTSSLDVALTAQLPDSIPFSFTSQRRKGSTAELIAQQIQQMYKRGGNP